MVIFLKVVLALVFIITGGAVFTEWGKRHKGLAFSAGVFALVGSYYVMQGIYQDFRGDVLADIEHLEGSKSEKTKQSSSYSVDGNERVGALLPSPEVNEKTLRLGENWGEWKYSKDGKKYAILVPKNKKLESLIRFPQYDTPQVKIYAQNKSDWIAAVGQDIDGKESTYYINEKTGKVVFARDDAKDIFWSPSGRYIVTLGGGEVDFFSIFDTQTGRYERGESIQTSSGLFYVKNAPMWDSHEEYFSITLEKVSKDRMDILDTFTARVNLPSLSIPHADLL